MFRFSFLKRLFSKIRFRIPKRKKPTVIRRDPRLFYVACIASGTVLSPFMYRQLIPYSEGILDYSITSTTSLSALGLFGAFSGYLLAATLVNKYVSVYNAFPIFFLSLLSPIISYIMCVVIMMAINLGISLLIAVFYIVVSIIFIKILFSIL